MSYSHVVVVMPDKNNSWAVRAKDAKATVDVTVKIKQKEVNAQHEEGDGIFGRMEAFYTNGKKSADTLAQIMARKFPGKQIAVLETKGIFESMPGEVVAKEFSEKGVLPA